MPDADKKSEKVTSLVRVHDLSDGFKLVGKFDFEEDSNLIRNRHSLVYKWANLNKLGDKAVALCRTPDFTFFIFTIPDCKLERYFTIKDKLETSYEHLDLGQRVIIKDNMMIFFFFDPNFSL